MNQQNAGIHNNIQTNNNAELDNDELVDTINGECVETIYPINHN